jgi:hypothetical protein
MKIKKNVNIYLNKESRAHNTKDTKGTALFIFLCKLVLREET